MSVPRPVLHSHASVKIFASKNPILCRRTAKILTRLHKCSGSTKLHIQSTLVISNFKGLYLILRDTRTPTWKIYRIEEKIIRTITRLYDKRDDFNFPIVNFPFLSSNIPSAPTYGVYVSQLIRYARTCSNYQDIMERGKVLTTKLLSQGYQKTKLVATLKKFYGRHHDLVNPYNVAVSRIVSDVFASDAP